MAARDKQNRQGHLEDEDVFGTDRGYDGDDHTSGDYWEEVGAEMTSGGEVDVERSRPSKARGSGYTTSGIEGEMTSGVIKPTAGEDDD